MCAHRRYLTPRKRISDNVGSDVSDIIIDIVVVQLPTYLYFCCYKGEVRFQLLRGIITYRLRR